jgi:hypothetical protein
MQKGARKGKEASPEVSGLTTDLTLPVSSVDMTFAVIHDEPHLTIVYEDGHFKGEVVDATLDKLEWARGVAGRYNLVIDHVRAAYDSPTFILHLSERKAPPQ